MREHRKAQKSTPGKSPAVANVIACFALAVAAVIGYFAYIRPTLTAKEGVTQIRNYLDRFEYDLSRIDKAVPDSIARAEEAVGRRGFPFEKGTEIALSELEPRLKPLSDSISSEWQTVQLSTRFTIAAMAEEPDSFCCLPHLNKQYERSVSLKARMDSVLAKIEKALTTSQ